MAELYVLRPTGQKPVRIACAAALGLDCDTSVDDQERFRHWFRLFQTADRGYFAELRLFCAQTGREVHCLLAHAAEMEDLLRFLDLFDPSATLPVSLETAEKERAAEQLCAAYARRRAIFAAEARKWFTAEPAEEEGSAVSAGPNAQAGGVAWTTEVPAPQSAR